MKKHPHARIRMWVFLFVNLKARGLNRKEKKIDFKTCLSC